MRRAILLATLFSITLAACSTTVESKPEAAKSLESGGQLPAAVTSFFGDDASKLQPGPEGGAALAYINPSAQWSKYTKIQLMPVEFWAASDTKVSESDQQMLTSYMYNKLQEDLSRNFTLVNQPGPDVMTLRVALMDATTPFPDSVACRLLFRRRECLTDYNHWQPAVTRLLAQPRLR